MSSKVVLSFIAPSRQAAFAICVAREVLCFKKRPDLGSSVNLLRFLQSVLKKILCWGRPRPESQKLSVEEDTHHLLSLYFCHFFALPLPGLQSDPGIFPTRG